MEIEESCPYCGASVTIEVDTFGGREQRYVEDCPACCRSWDVSVHVDAEGEASAVVARQDD
ncbi:MAG: CPXCG motif-containing cysteine-rich protein [Myxococcales bacterium]|nr:CPXCG motif-containing cysteine-rich protein [Myxococcales bacterium]